MAKPPLQPISYPQALSLRQLRFFVVLARLGNFSRAAEEMSVTQSALSAAIRQAETHLGVQLFNRTTHRVDLTEAGEAMLLHIQRLLTTADNVFSDMHDIVTRHRVTVRIGAIPSVVAMVSRTLVTLQAQMPSVNFYLADGKNDVLAHDIRTAALDVAICVAAPAQLDLESRTLFEDEMMLVTATGHSLATQGDLTWSDLRGEEIVHFMGGSIGELCSSALLQNNLAASSRYRVDQVDSLYGLVSSGLAVGIMPRLYTRSLDHQGTRLIALTQPAIRRQIVMLYRPELATEHPLGLAICDHLAAAAMADLGL